ncbi:endo alpha-1,4 polygalactosaminidase [Nocardioides sp.]|uniref:endo alpha-1,4 polygalactosaminidase n=1 Tax=Nocardioides sp. TaxID=35761 RepID=UPI00271C3138|nr:endo alpha-1,4 polygalactosaminidase [Nocardioides sp.]MDO9456025.1 endo alpha-1,4 polygalactosaminidase [Nocardioides sp.]
MRRLLGLLLASVLGLSLLTAAGGAASARVEPLPSGTDADYQLGGEDAVPDDVGIVARDRTARAVAGKYNICYVNGFQTQPNEKRFWRRPAHWRLVLKKDGRAVVDENWGEWLLDLRTPARRKRLAAIVGRWTAGCARDGFQAVEFDNLDSFTRSRRLLDRADALAFARLLVRKAHAVGLAAGQKNLAGYDGTRIGFDLAVSESCAQYDECGRYVRSFGDQVVMIEYRRVDFRRACAAYGDTHAVVLRDLDLSPSYTPTFC